MVDAIIVRSDAKLTFLCEMLAGSVYQSKAGSPNAAALRGCVTDVVASVGTEKTLSTQFGSSSTVC